MTEYPSTPAARAAMRRASTERAETFRVVLSRIFAWRPARRPAAAETCA